MVRKVPNGITPDQWEQLVIGLETNPSTVNDYRKVLNLLHSFENGRFHISNLSKDDAQYYFAVLDSRVEDGTLSANTAHRYKATLRSLGARLQQSGIYENYRNPFSQLVKNEMRTPTVYDTSLFLSRSTISKLQNVILSLPNDEALILQLMLYVGLTPAQIEDIRVKDFHISPSGHLALDINAGTFREKVKDISQSAYTAPGSPVRFVRSNKNGSITWEYKAAFEFFEDFAEKLRYHTASLGTNDDDRPYFLTSRHLPYNYRAVHHLVLTAADLAGIPREDITPNKISLIGLVHSQLLDVNLPRHAEIDRSLRRRDISPEERQSLISEQKEIEKIFIPLAKQGWIGNWSARYPIPMQERMDAIVDQLGIDTVLKILGI